VEFLWPLYATKDDTSRGAYEQGLREMGSFLSKHHGGLGSHDDLVAIDHRRAGYLITEHLLRLECRRSVFVGYSRGANA